MNLTVCFTTVQSQGGKIRCSFSIDSDATAGAIEAILRSRHELLTGWWIESAYGPNYEAFKARIEAEGNAAREKAIDCWNSACLAVLPVLEAAIKAVQAEKPGFRSSVLTQIRHLPGVIERCRTNKQPLSVGTEFRKNKGHSIGLSYKTWTALRELVAPENYLPLGI